MCAICWLLCVTVYRLAMDEHRAKCSKEGRYAEADIAQQRLTALKQQDHQQNYEQMLFQQEQER